MCFKKPKAPEKSPEDVAAEEELEELQKIRTAQLAREVSDQKESRTEDAIARAQGFMGNRSLLSGSRGGSGFLGRNTRSAAPIISRTTPAPTPGAPPIMGLGSVASLLTGRGQAGRGGNPGLSPFSNPSLQEY